MKNEELQEHGYTENEENIELYSEEDFENFIKKWKTEVRE